MKKLILLIISFPLFSSAFDTGVTFLLFHVGSRAMGMGGAYTAVSDDATATFYNPSGLSFVDKYEIMFMHYKFETPLWPEEHFCFLGGAVPLKKGTAGIGMLYSRSEIIEYLFDSLTSPGKFFGGNFALAISYGYRIKENVGLGMSFKYIYKMFNPYSIRISGIIPEVFDDRDGQTFALDFGLIYRFYLKKEREFLPFINFGTSFLNLGPSVKDPAYPSVGEELPKTLKIGFYLPFYNSEDFNLNLSFDITKVLNGINRDLKNKGFDYIWWEVFKHSGMEINYKFLYLWLGYFIDEEGGRKGLTYGGGVKFDKLIFTFSTDKNIFDYDTNPLSFTIKYIP